MVYGLGEMLITNAMAKFSVTSLSRQKCADNEIYYYFRAKEICHETELPEVLTCKMANKLWMPRFEIIFLD